jgi:hypothetical protein
LTVADLVIWTGLGGTGGAGASGGSPVTMLPGRQGGRTAAVLYSMTGTCKHHEIDPFAYLQDILRRLPSHPAD